MLKNFYKYFSRHGELLIYGDNMEICRPYINNVDFNSIEDICIYCKEHDLRIFHKPKRTLSGYLEVPCILRLTLKHSVHSSWANTVEYINTHPEIKEQLQW